MFTSSKFYDETNKLPGITQDQLDLAKMADSTCNIKNCAKIISIATGVSSIAIVIFGLNPTFLLILTPIFLTLWGSYDKAASIAEWQVQTIIKDLKKIQT